MVRLPSTSVGRLMLAVLTAGLGVAALRDPSPFWVGVVATISALWISVAVGRTTASRGSERLFWSGFAAISAGAILVSFGPWSDQSSRARWPDPARWPERSKALLPTTRLLVQLMPLVRPNATAVLTWENPDDVRSTLTLTSDFESLEGQDALRDEVARIAARAPLAPAVGRGHGGLSRAQRATALLENSLSMADYQAVGHLLGALVLGGLGGLIVKLGVPVSATARAEGAAA